MSIFLKLFGYNIWIIYEKLCWLFANCNDFEKQFCMYLSKFQNVKCVQTVLQ